MDSGITIREVRRSDHPACESLIRDAFWNVYQPGCHEHWLWHLAAAGHPDLIEPLMLAAVDTDEIVGCVMSTRGRIREALAPTPTGPAAGVGRGADAVDVVVPGPIAVAPARQGRGIGAALLTETLRRARELGERAAFLYGDPVYYARFGFREASQLGVRTADGQSFPAFMGRELEAGALTGTTGRLVTSALFDVDDAHVDEFDRRFPARLKEKRPGQL